MCYAGRSCVILQKWRTRNCRSGSSAIDRHFNLFQAAQVRGNSDFENKGLTYILMCAIINDVKFRMRNYNFNGSQK